MGNFNKSSVVLSSVKALNRSEITWASVTSQTIPAVLGHRCCPSRQ